MAAGPSERGADASSQCAEAQRSVGGDRSQLQPLPGRCSGSFRVGLGIRPPYGEERELGALPEEMFQEPVGRLTVSHAMHACECAQSCQTLCDLMDCSPPVSSVNRIFQARLLEPVAISFSRGSSPPRDGTPASSFSCIGRRTCWISKHTAPTT